MGYYILASLAIIQGLVALLEGIRYLRFVRGSLQAEPGNYTPKVAVLAPCKGIDPGFRETVRSLLGQDYPDYEVIFVTESESDPAYHQIEALLQAESHPHARLTTAGPAQGCGQKVHNLLSAIQQVSDDVEVLAFVDSDATPSSSWLRWLVGPLACPNVGATTGYRWYLPAPGNWWSLLRSLWNASIATALGPHKRNFTWGGSTAIRRETFEAAAVRQAWAGACTEDYSLSNAIKAQGLYVQFVPQCLIPSRGRCSWGELLQFTTRQVILTRVYAPRLWLLALTSNLLFFGAFYGGLGMLFWRGWTGAAVGLLPVVVSLVYFLGVLKAVLRQKAVELILGGPQQVWPVQLSHQLKRYRLHYYFLYPLANLLWLYNLSVSALSRQLEWRGIHYRIISPSEVVIVKRNI